MPKIYFFNYSSLGYSLGAFVEIRCMQKTSEHGKPDSWRTVSGMTSRGQLVAYTNLYYLRDALVLKDGQPLGSAKREIPLEPQNFPRQHPWRHERSGSGGVEQEC